jgi:cytoskeleton protein RodZ
MRESAPDLGGRLRMARHRRGKSLRDIAAVTKIPTAWLEAIERNDFDRLPGGIFRRAYIRAFAAEVGVDPEPLPEPVLSEPAGAIQLVVAPPWRRHLPTSIAVLLLLAALALLRVVESRAPRPDLGPVVSVNDGPEPLSASLADPAVTTSRPSASLELHFVGSSWVSASADGERVVHRLVAAGERLEIEARSLIAVEIGDAGVVEASVNAGPARLLGPPGHVRRIEVAPPAPHVAAGEET